MSNRHRLPRFARSSQVLCVLAGSILVVVTAPLRAADASDEAPLETKIVSATVYSRQAQIVRRGRVGLEPGAVRIVCNDLPEKLIETSLSVEGTGIAGARIIGIDLRRTPESGVDSPRLDELVAQFQKLEEAAAPLQARRRAIQERKRLAEALRNLSAERAREQLAEGAFSSTGWRALLSFHEDEQFESDERLRALDDDIADIETKMGWIRNEIGAMHVGKAPGKDLVIDCETAAPGTLTIELSYLVPDASWHPEYTVRYIERDSEIELTYWARIGQATGEDWENVSVVLSTASPHVGAAPPDLPPKYLGVTTGTLRGRVTDAATGSPLPYANVSIPGTAFGTTSSADGTYLISNVPTGVYAMQAAYMGYQTARRSRVGVRAGQTERVDLALDAVRLRADEVVVEAERPMIQTEMTSTRRALGAEDLKVRAITSVTEATATQPGVVLHEGDVHVRGGRGAEVEAVEMPPPIEHLGAELAGSEFAANLVIPKPVQLETGAEPRRSMVVRRRIAGEFVLHAVPRLSEHVFVRGTFENPLEIPILPGAAEVYVETVPEGSTTEVSDYVGRDALQAVAPAQEFTMHLGIDQNVKVEQEMEKETLSKHGSKTRKVQYRYATTAESFRRGPAALWIVDRIPVSAMKDVKVDDVRIVPEPSERGEDGILTWKLRAEPGQRQEIVTEYVIEYPSDMSAGSLGLEE
jgi:hypothetical protein